MVSYALVHLFGEIAQLVERRTHKPKVKGSIPFLATRFRKNKEDRTMGTGRTLRKESHVRPCKTPAGKARKSAAQRRRLVKFGLGEDEVKIMSDESVRVLVQRPTTVKKMLAKRSAE